jgi:hypothetical protein
VTSTDAGAVRRDRWLVVAVPLVLVLVAIAQLVAANTSTLTSWRGGGFGMFSTADAHDQRIVRATIEGPEASLPLDLRSLRRDARVDRTFVTARAWPTARNLDALAAAVAAAPLALDHDGIVRHAGADLTAVDDPVALGLEPDSTIRVRVWRVRFEPESDRVVPEELASREVRP